MVDFRKAFDLVDHQILNETKYSIINVMMLADPGLDPIYSTELSVLL